MSDAPIFIVGAGRSGTTLIYEILRGHPALAWMSNVSERFPGRAWAAAANRLAPPGPSPGRRVALRPVEGYQAFDWASPQFNGADSRPLDAHDLTPTAHCRLHDLAESHVRGMRRERFLNKNTRNTRRIPYLAAAFPDARFVHVIRHPYAVIASLLRVDFWQSLATWSESSMQPSCPEKDAVAAATLWRDEVRVARNSAEAPRHLEVRYEHVVSDPNSALRTIRDFTGIDASKRFDRHCSLFDIRDQDKPVWRRITNSQRTAVNSVVQAQAQDLQYDLSDP